MMFIATCFHLLLTYLLTSLFSPFALHVSVVFTVKKFILIMRVCHSFVGYFDF